VGQNGVRLFRTGDQRRLPRGLVTAFVAAVLLPSAMLVLLGIQLLEQDRALEERRRRELAETALDRAVTELQKELSSLQRRLLGKPEPADFMAGLTLLRDGIGPVLYLPVSTTLPEPPTVPFGEADRAEFQLGDLPSALAANGRLARSPDSAVRAGALLRIARLLRRAGDLDGALAAWGRLSAISGVSIAGEPAGLWARRIRCRALHAAGRHAELRAEAESFFADLLAGRWPVDRQTYLLASGQAAEWLGKDVPPPVERLEQAAALALLWPRRKTSEGSLCAGGYTLIWQGDNAVLAGRQIFRPPSGIEQRCTPGGGSAELTRSSNVTGLPWTLAKKLSDEPLPEFSGRRSALLAGFFALLILISAAAYLAWRSIARELGVARLQSDFVAAVSHEFRTPLTSLRQFTEMLLEEPDLPSDARLAYFEAQRRATGRLSRLVETLLDFGRMEAGRRPYRLEPADAAVLIRETVAEFAAEPSARGFDIQCRLPAGPLPVSVDRDAFWRALWNLLDNAVKYSGDRREIAVEASRSGASIIVRVIDHGLGIPPRDQARLFQKFVRGESIRGTGIPGTGIGLAMVRHIAEAHGGHIGVESFEGRGSTFVLTLPERV